MTGKEKIGAAFSSDGTPAIRTMMFPAAEAEITAIWDVVGLLGTGSDAYAVADLFVPREFAVVRERPDERRIDAALYGFTSHMIYAVGFAAEPQNCPSRWRNKRTN